MQIRKYSTLISNINIHIIVSFIFLMIFIYLVQKNIFILLNYNQVPGVVGDCYTHGTWGTSSLTRVKFETSDNKTLDIGIGRFELPIWLCTYDGGEQIIILYDPKKPMNAVIKDFTWWSFALLNLITGLLFLSVGLIKIKKKMSGG